MSYSNLNSRNETLSTSLTKNQARAAFSALAAIAEMIRELGSVPSGHLYAQLMGHMDLADYTRAIDLLKGAGLVTEKGFRELVWIGPRIN